MALLRNRIFPFFNEKEKRGIIYLNKPIAKYWKENENIFIYLILLFIIFKLPSIKENKRQKPATMLIP